MPISSSSNENVAIALLTTAKASIGLGFDFSGTPNAILPKSYRHTYTYIDETE